ncbi:MAG: SprT-like domain-containing protein [Burkholderiales bacterium]|nr:SprT-like domain-containing protein [Burkholderiales bacterium]
MIDTSLEDPHCPTMAVYGVLQRAFEHFNRTLFGGALRPCLLTLRSSSRYRGYHQKGRFVSIGGQTLDEIGLNPGYFTLLPPEEVLSTLVHEMVHHWQDNHGRPSAGNAHNRQWADRMEALGLMPTHTGLPGGHRAGNRMSHYIVPDGPFIASCRALLLDGLTLPWFDRHLPAAPEHGADRVEALQAAGIVVPVSAPPVQSFLDPADGGVAVFPPAPRRESGRRMLVCGQCGAKAWVTRDTRLICGGCQLAFAEGGNSTRDGGRIVIAGQAIRAVDRPQGLPTCVGQI